MDYPRLHQWLKDNGTGDDTADAAALRAATVADPGDATITPDDFVDRFTPAEWGAVLDSTDNVVRKFLFRLRLRQEPLALDGATVRQWLTYLASRSLLTAARATAIGAAPAGRLVAPCQQIGCGLMVDMDAASAALAVAYARGKGA